MDGIIAVAMALEMEAALNRERRKKRRMEKSLRAHQVALQKKMRERVMLARKKQDMLAEEAANKELIDHFMGFIDAIENNDPEIAQNFGEKAMMNTILPLLNSDGGVNGGFTGGDNVAKILDLKDKAEMDATEAIINSIGSCGGDNEGGSNNVPKSAHDLGQETTKGANNDGNEGKSAAGVRGICNRTMGAAASNVI